MGNILLNIHHDRIDSVYSKTEEQNTHLKRSKMVRYVKAVKAEMTKNRERISKRRLHIPQLMQQDTYLIISMVTSLKKTLFHLLSQE